MTRRELEAAWARSDELFALLRPEALLAQPIPLRQPFIFYLGHLPAFAWNHLAKGVLGEPPFEPRLDVLFARGIDPVGVDAYQPAHAEVWPAPEAAASYRDGIRAALRDAWGRLQDAAEGMSVAAMVVEHELMHHETLLYMVQQLPHDQKRPPGHGEGALRPVATAGTVRVPPGRATLGVERGAIAFGWDNEFPSFQVDVPTFVMDTLPVRNADFLDFVEAGGYRRAEWWDDAGWGWRSRLALAHPASWKRDGHGWTQRGVFWDVPFAEAAGWPAMVSWAEADAYARWKRARLPTEAEFHRAAYGGDGNGPGGRPFPWGEEEPTGERANLGLRRWQPVPAGAHPLGASPWGVHELVGNGWEWSGSPFAPFPGFTPMQRYLEYSADFFDGRHYVMLGASWATHPRLVRRSFRNWFQPHYPYVFSKFRLVRERD